MMIKSTLKSIGVVAMLLLPLSPTMAATQNVEITCMNAITSLIAEYDWREVKTMADVCVAKTKSKEYFIEQFQPPEPFYKTTMEGLPALEGASSKTTTDSTSTATDTSSSATSSTTDTTNQTTTSPTILPGGFNFKLY